MLGSPSVIGLITKLLSHLSKRRKGQLYIIFILVLVASAAEALSIGAVLPFLAVLTTPESVFGYTPVQPLLRLLPISSARELLAPMTVIFASAALITGIVRLLLLWASTRWSFSAGADLSIEIYERTLYQPYWVHLSRNSSEIISGISGKASSVISKILQVLTLIGSTTTLIVILFTLLFIDPFAATTSILGFSLIYICTTRLIRKRLSRNSATIALESTKVIKSLQEGLGGIREILLDRSQAVYCRQYNKADLALRQSLGSNTFLGSSPRPAVETFSIILIAILAYLLTKDNAEVNNAIPVLGAFALGGQRMLPALQQIYSAWVSLQGEINLISETIDLLEQPIPRNAKKRPSLQHELKEGIELKNISFRYTEDQPFVLRNVNIKISKGARIGFIGATGTGKSTLLDIIMGLLSPSEGAVLIDGEPRTIENEYQWQGCIAHVPQTVFLADSSIEDNIAFGIDAEKIDKSRVRDAAIQAQIHQAIDSWADGYSTLVGERGIRLSGGQRQRLGIARALYKKADVIIFDEATSALDTRTEEDVLRAIGALSKDLTILTVAHRLTTLRHCTQIFEINNGMISQIGGYDEYASRLLRSESIVR